MIYYIAKIFRAIILKMPLPAVLILAKTIGICLYFNKRRRMVAFRNVKAAFPKKSSPEIHSILRRSYVNFGLTVIENLIAFKIYKHIKLEEQQHLYPGGGIFVGIHAGNWEIAVSYWAQRHNFAIFVREQKHKGLDRFLNEIRREGKIKVCFTVKELIRCLRQNYMIGVVIDHGAGSESTEAEFFSHLVPTPKGAVYLAKKFNKKIYTTFCIRQKGFSHILEIGKAIDPEGRDDRDLLNQLNKVYEDYLRKYPWESLWYYKRFKYKKNRDVLILSDGKDGHLKQSKALLCILSQQGYKIRSKVLEAKYKDNFRRLLADILAFFTGRNWFGARRWLAFLLDCKTWRELDNTYADIVISAGSHMAAVNKLFSAYLGSKSAVILKPNIPLDKFDVAIIPEHDRQYNKNATMIKGALFCPGDDLEQKAKKCHDFFNLSNQKKIAVFLGGPLKDDNDFINNLKLFISKLKGYSLKNGYKIIISTSRRTPKKAEIILQTELKNFENTEAIVTVNQGNYDFVFEGFSYLADTIFVSSDSISMLSETISLSKPCLCYFLEESSNKHKVFLDSLKDEVVFLKPPYNIESMNPKVSTVFHKNKKNIEEVIGKLL